MVEAEGLSAPPLLELETPHGPGRAHVQFADGARALLVLGHGAGGGVGAADLQLAAGVAHGLSITVALTEQPYRVAGRRSPAPARQLDPAFIAMVAALRERAGAELPLITGGRSSGARVACRTAAATGAAGILCLAFPLLAPRRKDGTRPSRLEELEPLTVPALIVQGTNDPFGIPPTAPERTIVEVAGDHSLRRDHAMIRAAITDWLVARLPNG